MRLLSYFQYCKISSRNCTLIHVKATCVNENVKFLCFCLKLHLPDVMIPLSQYQVCGNRGKIPLANRKKKEWGVERDRKEGK